MQLWEGGYGLDAILQRFGGDAFGLTECGVKEIVADARRNRRAKERASIDWDARFREFQVS